MTATPGWAGRPFARGQLLSYLPLSPADPEPSYAVADAWTPPSGMALPGDVCSRVLAAARATLPAATGNGSYHLPELAERDTTAIPDRFRAANELWWQLDLDDWHIGVKRYTVGERHVEHQDIHPGGGGTRKLAGVVQLCDAHDYDGGDLRVHFAHHAVPMPRARGTLVALPAWTCHEVTTVTRGERWALICNANGPKLR